MTKYVSYVIIHHYFEGPLIIMIFTMTCCLVLSVIIVLMLLIILVFVVYMVVVRAKRQSEDLSSPNFFGTVGASRAVSNSYKEATSNRRTLSNQFPVFDERHANLNPSIQNIPMSTFNPETEDRQADSSNSSPGGLREFLFPPRHDGEIIYKAPPSVVAFAGQVFSTSRAGYRANSVTEPKVPRPGAAARHSDPVNATMEWDYFESRRYSTSEVSNEPGYNGINICWV